MNTQNTPQDFNQSQYEQHTATYLESNSNGRIGGETPENRIAYLGEYIKPGARILEIGSGNGRDAIIFASKGYTVTPSDYVDSFLDEMRKAGLHPLKLDAKHDDLPIPQDCIYANALFVHFSPEESAAFLQKAHTILPPDGVIFMSMIQGEGYARTARTRGFERDFYYYSLQQIDSILKDAGFSVLQSQEIIEGSTVWIQVVAQVS